MALSTLFTSSWLTRFRFGAIKYLFAKPSKKKQRDIAKKKKKSNVSQREIQLQVQIGKKWLQKMLVRKGNDIRTINLDLQTPLGIPSLVRQ